MEIPGLGPVVEEEGFGWHRSPSRSVAALGGARCGLILDGYDDDPDQDEYVAVVKGFLGLGESLLPAATAPVFDYYQDTMASVVADEDWDWFVEISGPDEVWNHVTLGRDVVVQRDRDGDGRVYVSVECECDWEPEHGLQLVFREGRVVSKVGPYDGHLTNASAFVLDDLANVVYRRINS